MLIPEIMTMEGQVEDSFIGSIILFSGSFAIYGFDYCRGQSYNISQNAALFSIMRVMYGGNGTTTFNLPNLVGRTPICFGQMSNSVNYALGNQGGANAVTLSTQQMPLHTHSIIFSSQPINASLSAISTKANLSNAQTGACLATPTSTDNNPLGIYATGSADVVLGGLTVGLNPSAMTLSPAGGTASVDVRQPYLALNYLICISGVYPAQP